jgi:Domain of unknown function DUF29
MHRKAAAAMDWELLAATSHFQTAIAIREKLQQQDYGEAMHGLEELIDALARADKRALESHLIRVMQHVIKWKMQPERRYRSWIRTIRNGRKEIRKLQQDTPSLTDQFIREQLWDDCLDSAMGEAEGDMDFDLLPLALTWQEVFEDEYRLH